MIYQKRKMCKTIMASDPAAFDRDFNCFVQNVMDKGYDYEIRYVDGMGALCCQVFYTATKEIPENLVEDHWLCEDEAHCYDCPIWGQLRAADPRGNKKYFRCEKCGGRISADSTACEWYYETLKGEKSVGRED